MLIDIVEDGETWLDDAPETPAPLFAVRAFKTALFGTPKPTERQTKRVNKEQTWGQGQTQDKAKTGSHTAMTLSQKDVGAIDADLSGPKDLAALSTTSDVKCDPLASPTKGILLTPGTAATKRKTVSFSARKQFRERTKSPDNALELGGTHVVDQRPLSHPTSEPQRKQSALTRTLIEMSTKRSNLLQGTVKSEAAAVQTVDLKSIAESDAEVAFKLSEPIVDATIDLSQPRSRSGQHWKTEYEEYQKKSTRELKRVIQYGQNVKSYATRKDQEATNLDEKLKKELAKVARMESKISKLAKQLKAANEQGPDGESEQARLVGELAQQTAMTVKYQRKADHYQKAIDRHSLTGMTYEPDQMALERLSAEKEDSPDRFEVATVQAQLESLRDTATAAESKAMKLEFENKQLKRNLARVKEEMMSYESRRQAREDRLKKREDRHKASKEQCELELASLKEKHQQILQVSQSHGDAHMLAVPVSNNINVNQQEPSSLTPRLSMKDATSSASTSQRQRRQSSPSPRKRRMQGPAVDIWTINSAHETPKEFWPNQEPVNLPPSSIKHDIDNPLQEIDYNLAVSESDPLAQKDSCLKGAECADNAVATSKPSLQRDTADGVHDAPLSRQSEHSTFGRSASFLSQRIHSRTNTMGSARTSSLSAERTAAAKARLADRKRSGEKKARKKTDRLDSIGQMEVF